MDKGLRPGKDIEYVELAKLVSILGLVDKGLRLHVVQLITKWVFFVSILGLVDKGLRHDYYRLKKEEIKAFQSLV